MTTRTDLRNALRTADLPAVRALLAAHPAWIEEADMAGVPLSLHAGETGSLALLRFLVETSRASLNAVDGENRDMLHYAARSGDIACCRYLVQRCGMDPLRPDRSLLTPLDVAHRLGHHALQAYFEDAAGGPLSAMYRNPIRRGMFPDPSIVRVGDDYYMVNASFVFFPGIPVSHSRDLIHWRVIGHAVANADWAGLDALRGGHGYWAPDISYARGRFYVCATYRMNDGGPVCRRQMVVTASRAEGPYSKPVFFDEDGIDPSIFHDDDGRHYMLINRGARIFEIDAAATRRLGETTLLYYGDQKRAPEGPHLVKKDGWYYLLLAEGGTGMGHRASVARARTLSGPYVRCPHNPILRQTDENALLQRCGHGKLVMTQHGDWYIVYLCGRALDGRYTLLGRETALDPVTWTADGWPLVNGGRGPSALQIRPRGLFADPPSAPDAADWITPRPPRNGEAAHENGRIRLRAGTHPLTDIRCRSLLVRRQTDFRFAFEVRLEASALPDGGEAGITCYYDEHSFITFGIARAQGQTVLRTREQIGHETRQHADIPLRPDLAHGLRLGTTADGLTRRFAFGMPQGTLSTACTLTGVTYLADEGVAGGKRFTGAMVGVYALFGAQALFCDIQYTDGGKSP